MVSRPGEIEGKETGEDSLSIFIVPIELWESQQLLKSHKVGKRNRMRQIPSYGYVGERGGSEPLYPDTK
jgi:hypothetical protein